MLTNVPVYQFRSGSGPVEGGVKGCIDHKLTVQAVLAEEGDKETGTPDFSEPARSGGEEEER